MSVVRMPLSMATLAVPGRSGPGPSDAHPRGAMVTGRGPVWFLAARSGPEAEIPRARDCPTTRVALAIQADGKIVAAGDSLGPSK